jgi:hypothetical protein
MQYIIFTLLFTLFHTIAYTLAGMIALRFSKDIYEGENRLFDFMRDMSTEEGKSVSWRFFPAQILRGAADVDRAVAHPGLPGRAEFPAALKQGASGETELFQSAARGRRRKNRFTDK